MVKRIRRACLGSIAAVGLFASAGLAGPGPGGVSDGDPDIPHYMKPSGAGKYGAQDVARDTASGASTAVVSAPSSELWQKALQVYVRLQSVFFL
jgi:hypothetical protein